MKSPFKKTVPENLKRIVRPLINYLAVVEKQITSPERLSSLKRGTVWQPLSENQ